VEKKIYEKGIASTAQIFQEVGVRKPFMQTQAHTRKTGLQLLHFEKQTVALRTMNNGNITPGNRTQMAYRGWTGLR